MKAAVLYELGKPLVIEDGIDLPALKIGQVLVKIAYSGVCRSQLMEVRGLRGEDQYLPHLLGHEGSGEVVDVGPGVTKVKKGGNVILGWIKGSGIDSPSTQYTKNGVVLNAGAITTFSDYSIVSENRLVKLPPGVPQDVAVLFGCALPTGAGMLINQIESDKFDSIAFVGLGGIGLSALLAAKLFPSKTVIAIDVEDGRLQIAREFGATHTINSSLTDPYGAIMELTNGKGVDYCIESAGFVETIETAFSLVRKNGGKCIFASHPKQGNKIRLDPHDLISGKRIEGSWGGGCCPDEDIPRLAKLYIDEHLPLDRLISKRYSLNGVNDALDDLENGKVFRALIEL